MPIDHRLKIVIFCSIVAVMAMFSVEPFTQDPGYHQFADQRTVIRIANFYNVLSNLPFIIIGHLGLCLVMKREAIAKIGILRPGYFSFFAGVFLTGFGSSYYHYHPDNQTLMWDRLPLAIAFMAFFNIVIGECISGRLAMKLLAPLLVAGLASVIYWYGTELVGRGDLRPYALVQFLPLVLIPLILWLFKPSDMDSRVFWGMLWIYAMAKMAEFYDAGLYQLSGWVSGHSLKHLLMAAGVLLVYWGLRKRVRESE